MDLDQALRATEPAPDARRIRATHPKGFEPGVKYAPSGDVEQVTLSLKTIPEDEQAWRDEITRVTTIKLPEGRRVWIREVRYWGNPADPMVYVAFGITDRETQPDQVDHVATLTALRKDRSAKPATFTGDAAFLLSWNDWQAGKAIGGGTVALLERFDAQIKGAQQRVRELRKIGRDLGRLVIIGGGDMVEGCSIYPNQPFELDLDGRRRQVNVVTDMILDGIDRLAPLFEDVTVLAVGGNHGENRIKGNRTSRHDNDDCLVFENAARATSRDPRLQHVNYVIAEDEPAKTLDVCGWILATTHGQAFGKGAGGPEKKAQNWYKGQAGGHFPAGDAHVLVSHHYHHKAERDWGACLWVQTPANDGGSPQHSDLMGEATDPGMLSFVMTPQRRYQDAQVL